MPTEEDIVARLVRESHRATPKPPPAAPEPSIAPPVAAIAGVWILLAALIAAVFLAPATRAIILSPWLLGVFLLAALGLGQVLKARRIDPDSDARPPVALAIATRAAWTYLIMLGVLSFVLAR